MKMTLIAVGAMVVIGVMASSVGRDLIKGALKLVGLYAEPPTIEPGRVVYDGDRFYRITDVDGDKVTIHFVISVAELDRIESGTKTDDGLYLGGYHFRMIDQGTEAIELVGTIPAKYIRNNTEQPPALHFPFS